jgi:hypothetical protein
VTTKHAVAVVILLAIAGTPATTLLCVGACAPDGAPASAACHHQMEAATAVGVKDADDTCARLLATSPFVKEDIQLATRAAMPASAPYVSVHSAPGEAQLAPLRDVASAVLHRPVSAVVLRL